MIKRLTPLRKPSQLSSQASYALLATTSLLGLSLFAIAYYGMAGNQGIGIYDQAVTDWFVSHRNASMTLLFSIGAALFHPSTIGISGALLSAVWAYRRHEVWRPLLLFASLSLAVVLSLGIKALTANPRPGPDLQLPPYEPSFSFPSAHTVMAVTFVAVAFYLMFSRIKNQRWLTRLTIGASLLALFVLVGRLYLAAHWLTDVIGGIGVALLIAALVVAVDLSYGRFVAKQSSD